MMKAIVTIWCAIALVGVAGATCPEVVGAVPASRPLRFVTFNVLHGGLTSEIWGDADQLDTRLTIAIEQLRAIDADVVGLQEASTGSRRGDVSHRLASALGFHHVHAATTHQFGTAWLGAMTAFVLGIDEGPAIVSRFPIGTVRTWPLDRCGTLYRRVLLCAEVCTPWGTVEACSTHLNGSECQAKSIDERLRTRSREQPMVLMGDLNATEDSTSIRLLREGLGFVDTFRAVNPFADGFTDLQEVEEDEPTTDSRIDYVLIAPGWGRSPRVVASRVVLNTPGRDDDGDALWPSDHYGVLSEVDVLTR